MKCIKPLLDAVEYKLFQSLQTRIAEEPNDQIAKKIWWTGDKSETVFHDVLNHVFLMIKMKNLKQKFIDHKAAIRTLIRPQIGYPLFDDIVMEIAGPVWRAAFPRFLQILETLK